MNKTIYVATESGKILRLDLDDFSYIEVFQDPEQRTAMGLVIKDNRLYFGGHALLGHADIIGKEHSNVVVKKMYKSFSDGTRFRILRKLKLDQFALRYRDPAFHQMNIVGDRIYISATGCNEIWEFSWNLNLKRRISIQPRIADYNHINNVFWDGEYFYVCLMRYCQKFGYGGYAKFDSDWIEIERRRLGWESHGFCVIDGKFFNLCSSAGSKRHIHHPHRAGLMVDGDFVFEHDPDEYYCKDFSMDDGNVYIVGGGISNRNERKKSNAIIFVLDRKYNLVDKIQFKGIGGFSGCRLPAQDYTNGPGL